MRLPRYLGEKPAKEGCGKPLGTKEAVVVSWAGLRGAVGLALAIVVWHEEGGSHSTDKAAEQATRLVFHVAMMAALTLAVNAPTTAPLLRALGLGRTDEKTLTIRSLVVYNVGATCRGVFDALRNAQNCTHSGRCRPFDASKPVTSASTPSAVHSPAAARFRKCVRTTFVAASCARRNDVRSVNVSCLRPKPTLEPATMRASAATASGTWCQVQSRHRSHGSLLTDPARLAGREPRRPPPV